MDSSKNTNLETKFEANIPSNITFHSLILTLALS